MRLPRGWYVVFDSRQVRTGRTLAARRFGMDVVAWRSASGAVVLQRDRCPHRLARLSLGPVQTDGEGAIACPFHGFEFDPQGACRLIPELRRGSEKVRVDTFPVREAHGWVWAFWGPPQEGERQAPAWFENLQDAAMARHLFRVTWPTHFTRSVENQLDYAHLPYVHRRTIGRFAKPDARPDVECTEQRIRWGFGDGREGFIEYRFPNTWQNCISGSFALTLAFVPVDEGHTELYLCSHLGSAAARLPGIGRVMGWMVSRLNRVILDEDRRVVVTQEPLDSLEGDDEILVHSDRAVRWFRKRIQATAWKFGDTLQVSDLGSPGPLPDGTDSGDELPEP